MSPPTGPESSAGSPSRPSSEPTIEPTPEPPATCQDLLRWAEALSGIARTGLGFTESGYERERFEEVLAVAADLRVAAHRGDLDHGDLVAEWMSTVGRGVAGYQTPKVAVGAVVANDAGEILLVQRADSGVWLYPTGWADIGYSASEIAVKEVHEETGIQVEVVRPIMVLDGLRLGFTRIPLYSVVFHCQAVGGDLAAHPLECADVGFFGRDALPDPLAGFDHWGEHAFRAIAGEPVDVLYDVPRADPWRRTAEDGDPLR
jgi:ADP-ribose pyrophosphatase YjhB (NUDIX family)